MTHDELLTWKKCIQEFARELGFVGIGFTSAEPLTEFESYLRVREQAGYTTPFVNAEPKQRTDPKAVWEECQTVVSLAYPLPFTRKPQKGEGIIARSAVGEDYHTVLRKRLEKLIEKMMKAGWPSAAPRFQVDTGPLNERAFATRSGLGWIGRNHQLIIPGVGSFVALALLLLEQALPPDEPLENRCGACQKCVTACPSQILGQKHFEGYECLSYLTQSKEFLTEEQGRRLGRRLFGCDTCQEACPHNQTFLKREEELNSRFASLHYEPSSNKMTDRNDIFPETKKQTQEIDLMPNFTHRTELTHETELSRGTESSHIKDSSNETEITREAELPSATLLARGADLYEVLNLSKAEFNERFHSTAAGWRGKAILQRNAYRVMKNLKDERLATWRKENREKKDLSPILMQELNRDREV